MISEKEGVKYDPEALDAIYDITEGDMRRAINILQAAAALGKVTVSSVYKVVGLAHPKEIREMIQLALNGNFSEARERLRKIMIDYGLSGVDVIKQIHKEIFDPDMKIDEELRVYIADYAGEINYRLIEGADDEIQLNAFLARLVLLGKRLVGSKS
jgi:replication factor C small subunit